LILRTSYLSISLLILLGLLGLALVLPVLTIWSAWLSWDAGRVDLLQQMLDTVLPDYTLTSVWLCLGVAVGVTTLGLFSAVLVSLFEFPGRRLLAWALLLPLAMPAYIVAYAYTDFLQFSGPLQTALREAFGWEGALLPNIRSVWGAMVVFSFTLYPYVYLLARAALIERASGLMEAARLLGAPLFRRIMTVAIPMARPAVVAGVALALMETLADFGVSSYFGIQTFTAGIYKAWLVLDDQMAAAQLSTVLLVGIFVLLRWEQQAQAKSRFYTSRLQRHTTESAAHVVSGWRAWGLLALGLVPVVVGFALPAGMLLHTWLSEPAAASMERFFGWSVTSLRLSMGTAVLAVTVTLLLCAMDRLRSTAWSRGLTQLIGLGYAIPGAVVVVGILLPLGWLQQTTWGNGATALVIGSSLGLVWAYLVRFGAVAMQSIQSGYSRIPKSMDESSRSLGVSGWALFRRLHLPQLRRSSVVALLLVFVDVMKELPVTLVLRPFDSDTLAVVVYQLARDERLGEAALPSLALVLCGLIPVILLSRTLDEKR
jgi:iron(III) transport system permease protein